MGPTKDGLWETHSSSIIYWSVVEVWQKSKRKSIKEAERKGRQKTMSKIEVQDDAEAGIPPIEESYVT